MKFESSGARGNAAPANEVDAEIVQGESRRSARGDLRHTRRHQRGPVRNGDDHGTALSARKSSFPVLTEISHIYYPIIAFIYRMRALNLGRKITNPAISQNSC